MLPSFAKLSPMKNTALQRRLVEMPTAESRHLSRTEEVSVGMAHHHEKATPLPSKLKRFRVNVPSSMDAGEIMNIRLDNVTTKVQITAPTTKKTISSKKKVLPSATNDNVTGHDSAPPSPTPTSGSNTTSAASSSYAHTMTDKYATPHRRAHDRTKCAPTSSKTSKSSERKRTSVLLSTDIRVPDGKRIVEAKAVVVIHAVFPQPDKALKEAMVDEVMRHMIHETLDYDCNAMLGLTITIKSLSNKPETGFLVKASGTPCLLLPTQVVVSSTSSSTSTTR